MHIKYLSCSLVCMSLLFLSLFSCSSSATRETNNEKSLKVKPVTETFLLEKAKLSANLQIPGELIAYQQVDIYAKINSFVKKVLVDVGSEVKTGQLLVSLEAPEISSQLSGAESRLKAQEAIFTASRSSYRRLLETSRTPGTISKNDLEQALARKNSDSAQLMAIRSAYREIADQKSYLDIRAPFTGVISSRNINPGAFVGPGGKSSELPLFSLEQQNRLRLVISIPEEYTGQLSEKDSVSFTVKSIPGKLFKARIIRMAGSLDRKLRSERIEMDVYNTDKTLLPGMYAEVNIPISHTQPTFIVPASSLVISTEGIYVMRIYQSKLTRVAVTRGNENSGLTEIFGKLADHDTLVLHANDEMHDGAVMDTRLTRKSPAGK